MDALKKAEQDKKKAAGSNDVTQPGTTHGGDVTHTDTLPGQKAHPADTTQVLSESPAAGDATQILPQSPLAPGDETQAISETDSDEFDDFLDDSSEALSLEPLPEDLEKVGEETLKGAQHLAGETTAESTQVLEQPAAPTAPDQTTQVMNQPSKPPAPGLDQTTAQMTRSRGDDTDTAMPTVERTSILDSEPPVFQELSLVDEDVTDPGASGGGEGFSPLETDATLPSARVVESDLKDYFDASQSIEVSKLDLSATHGVPTYNRRTAPGEATQVTAQTMFTAIRSPSSSRLFKWSVAIVFVLAVALGAAGFYYYYQSPTVRQAPSPMVARGVESEPPSADTQGVIPIVDHPVAATEPEPLIGPASSYADIEAGAEASVAAAAESFDSQADSALESVLADEPGGDAERLGLRGGSDAQQSQPAAETPAVSAAPQQPAPSFAAAETASGAANTQAALVGSDGLMVQPGAIRISRAKPQSNRSSIMLSNAYDAYRQGDVVSATKLYEASLAREPDSRDAHLGLAAIAMQRGDRQTAFDHYVAVLRNNPKDSVANAAVFAMQNGSSPLVNEARLKILLDQNPGADYLHFALGNNFARQRRWPEAQQEFFSAYTGNPENPVYALNLAVSLDHLGQHKAALAYYQVALKHNKEERMRPHISGIIERINALSRLAR